MTSEYSLPSEGSRRCMIYSGYPEPKSRTVQLWPEDGTCTESKCADDCRALELCGCSSICEDDCPAWEDLDDD